MLEVLSLVSVQLANTLERPKYGLEQSAHLDLNLLIQPYFCDLIYAMAFDKNFSPCPFPDCISFWSLVSLI